MMLQKLKVHENLRTDLSIYWELRNYKDRTSVLESPFPADPWRQEEPQRTFPITMPRLHAPS